MFILQGQIKTHYFFIHKKKLIQHFDLYSRKKIKILTLSFADDLLNPYKMGKFFSEK